MIVSLEKTNQLKWLFIAIFVIAPIKNSLWVFDTPIGFLINILQIILLLIICTVLLINKKDQITLSVFLFLFISTLYTLSLGSGYIEVVTTFILSFTLVKVGDFSFIIIIAYYYLIITTSLLLLQITGLYHFPSNPYSIIKGESIQLGFRNINTFAFYTTQSIIIGFIFTNRKILLWGSVILLVSFFYTNTRTPIVVILISLITYIIIIKPMWIGRRAKSIIICLSVFFVFCTGFLSIIFAKEIGDIDMIWLVGESYTLNELSSERITMILDGRESISILEWLIGDIGAPVKDSFYLFIISKYGLLLSILYMIWVIKRIFHLMEHNSYRITLFIFSVIIYGLFEMTISPYSFMSIFFYIFLFDLKNIKPTTKDSKIIILT